MIPWFVAGALDWAAGFFGYQVNVRASSGNWWGCERLYFIRNPGARRLPKIKARKVR